MIEKGWPETLGASFIGEGTNFAVYSAGASGAALCLYDNEHREIQQLQLRHQTGDIWHGYVPGCRPDQLYGYRLYGDYEPEAGLRFNSNKLLIDPYARELSGEFRWSPAVFDFELTGDSISKNMSDSAPFVPKSVVTSDQQATRPIRNSVPWSDMIVYELNVRGYTMRHPDISDKERGTFRGLSNGKIISYLKSLGITSIELMPVHTFIDEKFLIENQRRNFWGYNTINFFSPTTRYAVGDARREFSEMVNVIHDAGMEVILDVAYNHTGEGDESGPTICFRGIDNLSYYRTEPDQPGQYINDTGCGNTINVDNPRVSALIIDSLRYWSTAMKIDGFRFDLATILGRTNDGFTNQHPFLQALEKDEILKDVKLIAEPWDPGPGGYQLGQFPARWAEWNDRYRDSIRRFWRGDSTETPELAKRLLGSADIFEASGRKPYASINFVTAHDGFTLSDVVSYESKHNHANNEQNDDGHAHNFSSNYGIEGETDNPAINSVRRRQRLNMFATLLTSQGTPMILAGDELGNSQLGNNNAYAQDNETAWIKWPNIDSDPDFLATVRQIIQLRKRLSALRQIQYLHGDSNDHNGHHDIAWLHPGGRFMEPKDWADSPALGMLISVADSTATNSLRSVLIVMNSAQHVVRFSLPATLRHIEWELEFSTADNWSNDNSGSDWNVPAQTLICMSAEQ